MSTAHAAMRAVIPSVMADVCRVCHDHVRRQRASRDVCLFCHHVIAAHTRCDACGHSDVDYHVCPSSPCRDTLAWCPTRWLGGHALEGPDEVDKSTGCCVDCHAYACDNPIGLIGQRCEDCHHLDYAHRDDNDDHACPDDPAEQCFGTVDECPTHWLRGHRVPPEPRAKRKAPSDSSSSSEEEAAPRKPKKRAREH
jgi:hypothetical protein